MERHILQNRLSWEITERQMAHGDAVTSGRAEAVKDLLVSRAGPAPGKSVPPRRVRFARFAIPSPRAVIGSKKFLKRSTKAVSVPTLMDKPDNVPFAPLHKSRAITAAINICIMGEYRAEYLAASLSASSRCFRTRRKRAVKAGRGGRHGSLPVRRRFPADACSSYRQPGDCGVLHCVSVSEKRLSPTGEGDNQS